jgi:hypothetical protein
MSTKMSRAGVLFLVALWPALAGAATVQVNGSSGPITVAVGSTITVTVTGGPGNPGDWMALYAAGAQGGSWLDWRWLKTDTMSGTVPPAPGVTSGTVHLVVPSTAGQYQVNLQTNNTYNIAASSAAITASTAPPPPPPPSVVSSVTGSGTVACTPMTGDVKCVGSSVPGPAGLSGALARGTPVAGSACQDGASLFDTNGTSPTSVNIYVCDQTLHWFKIGPFPASPR